MEWRKTVDIKSILQPYKDMDQVSDVDAKTSGIALAALLTRELPEYEDGPDFCFVDNQRHLNDELTRLYDWADLNQVWLGLYTP